MLMTGTQERLRVRMKGGLTKAFSGQEWFLQDPWLATEELDGLSLASALCGDWAPFSFPPSHPVFPGSEVTQAWTLGSSLPVQSVVGRGCQCFPLLLQPSLVSMPGK